MLRSVYDKNTNSNISREFVLLTKNSILLIIFSYLFLKTKKRTYFFEISTFKWHPNTAKTFNSPEQIVKHVEHLMKLIVWGVKNNEPKSTLAKKLLKSSWQKR